MFKIVFIYAFRNILRMRLRSLFTILSIILIVSLYTVLSSIGDSFTNQISKMIENQNVDIAIQAKFASTPINSIIQEETITKIKKYQEIASIESILIERKRLDDDVLIFILGLSNFDTFAQRFGFSIIKGRSLKDSKKELVVGEKMAKVLRLDIGSKFQLDNDQEYLIVGIYSSWLNFLNAGLMIDIEEAQDLVQKPGKVNSLFITLKDKFQTQYLVEKINKDFPKLKAITGEQFPNYLGPIKSVFYFSKIVSLLTLLIATAVLLNTFIMAINERTKEVGILSAIGWSKTMIISVFLIEAMLLSFGGGFIGFASAYPVMTLLQNNFSNIYMYLPEAPNFETLIDLLLMCFIISIVSVLFPILYTLKIVIAKAIRNE